MKKFIKWLIKKFLPGYHLSKNPKRKEIISYSASPSPAPNDDWRD